MPTFTHSVTLHFRSISLTDVPFDTHFENAKRVYAQYGIDVRFGSGQSLLLPADQAARLNVVDGRCRWTLENDEFREVHQLGGSVRSTEILVFYVNRRRDGKIGCGGHLPNRPACLITGNGSQWTTAHEVGHVLLTPSFSPVHTSDTRNLMYQSTPAITACLPGLTPAQVRQIKRSPCCVRV